MTVSDEVVVIKGSKGEVKVAKVALVSIDQAGGQVTVKRQSDSRQARANHGLQRSLLANAVEGVTKGYQKTLKLIGVGYRVQAKGKGLSMTLGFSHPVEVPETLGVTFAVEGNDTIIVSGVDKQQIGQVAANIRALRPPEPYKGKGIRYAEEQVIRKEGKAAA